MRRPGKTASHHRHSGAFGGSAQENERRAIAHAAARLIEEGQPDYGAAKRKAARQLGIDDADALPDNREIEAALAERQQLFAPHHHDEVAALRHTAADVMQWLAAFEPRISGPVLTGTANRYSTIELDIGDVDVDEKTFTFFLLNHRIDADIRPVTYPDGKPAGQCYSFRWQDVSVDVTLLPSREARNRLFPPSSLRHRHATHSELLAELATPSPTSA